MGFNSGLKGLIMEKNTDHKIPSYAIYSGVLLLLSLMFPPSSQRTFKFGLINGTSQ
jgi:hypothetical protein